MAWIWKIPSGPLLSLQFWICLAMVNPSVPWKGPPSWRRVEKYIMVSWKSTQRELQILGKSETKSSFLQAASMITTAGTGWGLGEKGGETPQPGCLSTFQELQPCIPHLLMVFRLYMRWVMVWFRSKLKVYPQEAFSLQGPSMGRHRSACLSMEDPGVIS